MKYKVVLQTVGKEYVGKGDTVDEAIANLGLSWEHIKGKGTMFVTTGKRTYEHFFPLRVLRRIFTNKMNRLLWGKRLELLIGE